MLGKRKQVHFLLIIKVSAILNFLCNLNSRFVAKKKLNLVKYLSIKCRPLTMSIKQYIQSHVDSNFSIDEELPFPTEVKVIPKNTIISPCQKIEHQAYYLLSGIVKISIYNEEGTERVLEFFFPNSFFAAYTSFLTQQASDVEIEALTDCEVEIIKHYDIHKAYETSLLANRLGRAVAEQYYIRKTNREKDFLTKSAVERYKNLLDNRPELVQQIPVQLIAKYLGIEPESLSRIRKSIS